MRPNQALRFVLVGLAVCVGASVLWSHSNVQCTQVELSPSMQMHGEQTSGTAGRTRHVHKTDLVHAHGHHHGGNDGDDDRDGDDVHHTHEQDIAFTQEALARFVDSGEGRTGVRLVMLAFSNVNQCSLTRSLSKSMSLLGLADSFIAVAFDDECAGMLEHERVRVIKLSAMTDEELSGLLGSEEDMRAAHGAIHNEVAHGGAAFRVLNRIKYAMMTQILRWGVSVLSLDNDVAVVADPVPWLVDHVWDVVDIAAQLDVLKVSPEQLHDGLATLTGFGVPCVGILFARAKPQVVELFTEWGAAMLETDKLDQMVLADVIGARGIALVKGSSQVWEIGGGVRYGGLSLLRFPNGHIYKVQRFPQRVGVPVIAVHTTFAFAGTAGKINSMRENGLFNNEPDYYEGQFLSLDLDFASGPQLDLDALRELPRGGFPVSHMMYLAWQIDQVFDGLALARKLGRVLILPRLLCGCTRFFHFVPKCVPEELGETLTLPMVCPTDDVLLLAHWEKRGIPWRDAAFLDGPDTPLELRRSRITVRLGVASASTARLETVTAAQLATAGADLLATEPFASHRVLHLGRGVVSRVGRSSVTEPRRNWPFTCETRDILGSWCCSEQSFTQYAPLSGERGCRGANNEFLPPL